MNFGALGFPGSPPPAMPPSAYLSTQSSGTYEVPANVYSILVLCVGGAGGGASTGAGKSYTPLYGNGGGTTSFGTFLSATGGTGAASATASTSRPGGVGGAAMSVLAVTPGMRIPYTVGGGGASNVGGNVGNFNGSPGSGVGGNIFNRNASGFLVFATGPAGQASSNTGLIIVMPR